MLMDSLKGNRVTIETAIDGFLRHIRDCQNAILPGDRRPFLIGERQAGWVKPVIAEALQRYPGVEARAESVVLRDGAILPRLAEALAGEGYYRLRGEAFDVRAEPDGPVLAVVDRGALPSFGISATGVHVNGLVRGRGGLQIWVGRRAKDRMLDPGKLDHVTAGGVPAGLSPEQTMVKEAQEEAAIPAEIAQGARRVGTIRYAMERAEGLRRDVLHCYDLELPADFVPRSTDGEVAVFELWPVEQVMRTVRETDEFKFNVNLVLIDLFLREGRIAEPGAAVLRAALNSGHT
jgi:8-oxo-dGTP pyrophosphatase MutT (NUDIX family)